jgi:DNA invertase Pin-like site-specific DNA recombinase
MPSNSTPTRCVIYCRVSTTGQEDNTSLDSQESACRAWAQECGLTVVSIAREVWSGADRHRPELDALIDRLAPGDVVLAYDLIRLSRGETDRQGRDRLACPRQMPLREGKPA